MTSEIIYPRFTTKITIRNYTCTIGSTVGTVVGVASNAAAELNVAETGMVNGIVTGPASTLLNGLAGVLMDTLIGDTVINEHIYGNLLYDYECAKSHHAFGGAALNTARSAYPFSSD